MIFHLLAHMTIIILLPFWIHDNKLVAAAQTVTHLATTGFIFAVFSQTNHLCESALDPEQFKKRHAGRDPALNASWAVEQVETSNNYCCNSYLWHLVSGGLNLQIEHHLFPGLNHCHLHRIQPTVQAVCEEHGVCYENYDNWTDLMNATLSWYSRLASEPVMEVK